MLFSRLRKSVSNRKDVGNVVQATIANVVQPISEVKESVTPKYVPAVVSSKSKATLSVVLFIRNMKVSYLAHALHTLSNQSYRPTEIILVESSTMPDVIAYDREIASRYPLVRIVLAPNDPINISYSINVGFQSAIGQYVMTAQADLLYSKDVISCVHKLLGPRVVVQSNRGDIPIGADIGLPENVHKQWPRFRKGLMLKRPTLISPGTIIVMPRDWLVAVHGLDEIRTPYNYCDSNLLFRAARSGFTTVLLPWEKCQILHIGHPIRPEYYMSSAYPLPDIPIVVNPTKWGNIWG